MSGWSEEQLRQVERAAVHALIKQALTGSIAAASAALVAIEKVRKTQAGLLHAETMARINHGPELVEYLARLGCSVPEVERQLGVKLGEAELEAWARGQDDRLLEVRAVELSRMRRGEVEPPAWARRQFEVPGVGAGRGKPRTSKR